MSWKRDVFRILGLFVKPLCDNSCFYAAGRDGLATKYGRRNLGMESNSFDLPVVQFDGIRAAEDIDHNGHAAVRLIDR